VHVNATNIAELIPPQRGATVTATIENNMNAVLEQRERTGQPMFPHLNHPNYSTAVTVEEMLEIQAMRFFEVYNGHRGVRNYGEGHVKHLDRKWDIMLARRLGELNMGVLYALAVDDAHHYDHSNSDVARPGRGWIVVRSKFLTPEHLIAAIEKGDFYASNGVTLRSVQSSSTQLAIEVEPEEGVTYTIEFIGTREDYDTASEPVRNDAGDVIRATIATAMTSAWCSKPWKAPRRPTRSKAMSFTSARRSPRPSSRKTPSPGGKRNGVDPTRHPRQRRR
jgi:hypothetical protein